MRRWRFRPTHPGEMLRCEFLPDYGLDCASFAAAIDVPVGEVTALLQERRSLDADIALRVARYFGSSPEMWMAFQRDVDFFDAMEAHGDSIESIEPIDPGSALSVREYDPLPEHVIEDIKERVADLDDTTRWMIGSAALDEDPADETATFRTFYEVESGCWTTGIEHGTAFKREREARAVAAGLGDGVRVFEAHPDTLERAVREQGADLETRKRFLRRSRKGLRLWSADEVLRSEDDMAAYLEDAAEEEVRSRLREAVADVLSAMRARYADS